MLLAANQARAQEARRACQRRVCAHQEGWPPDPFPRDRTTRQTDSLMMDAVQPPPTDKGNVDPFWYSFSLSHKKGLRGRLGAAGHHQRPGGCQGPRRRGHAHQALWLPRTPLARVGRMGLHDRRQGARHLHRLRRQGFRGRHRGGRPVVFPERRSPLHPGAPGQRRLRVPARVRRRPFLRVRDLPHLRVGGAHTQGNHRQEPERARLLARTPAQRKSSLFSTPRPFGDLEAERKQVADTIGYSKRSSPTTSRT